MNIRLFLSGSVLVQISLVRCKYVPICMCIVKVTYYIRIHIYAQQLNYRILLWLESGLKYMMFEFLLSIRVSFWLLSVGHMPRRCAATQAPNRFGDAPLRKLVSLLSKHISAFHFYKRKMSQLTHCITLPIISYLTL